MAKTKNAKGRVTPKGARPARKYRKVVVVHCPRKMSMSGLPFQFPSGSTVRSCRCGWMTVSPDKEKADEALGIHLKEARG